MSPDWEDEEEGYEPTEEELAAEAAARAKALSALEDAIAAFAEYTLEKEVVVDALLIVGSQYIDDDGDRQGRVALIPRGGSQPTYITLGLLNETIRLLQNTR